ncbi:hypothetical protein D3C86_1116820 [compost metagenome]
MNMTSPTTAMLPVARWVICQHARSARLGSPAPRHWPTKVAAATFRAKTSKKELVSIREPTV